MDGATARPLAVCGQVVGRFDQVNQADNGVRLLSQSLHKKHLPRRQFNLLFASPDPVLPVVEPNRLLIDDPNSLPLAYLFRAQTGVAIARRPGV